MVRFSCFHLNNHTHKPKKAIQPSTEAMYKKLEDCCQIQALPASAKSISFDPPSLKEKRDSEINDSVRRVWKSEEMDGKLITESSIRVHMKKSQSLGSGLDRVPAGIDTEDETDHAYSCDDSQGDNGLVFPGCSKDPGITSPPNQHKEDPPCESPYVGSDMVNNESIFSIDDCQHPGKADNENSDTQLSGDCAIGSEDHTLREPQSIVKSCSLPNIADSEGYSPPYCVPNSRSSEDLIVLDTRRKENVVHEVEIQETRDQERDDDNVFNVGKNASENAVDDGCELYGYVNLAKDWIMPAVGRKSIPGESSFNQRNNDEFKMKRIKEWVSDLQYFSPLEEAHESSISSHGVNKSSVVLDAPKLDEKASPGMEVAKRYISALTASASTVQLANHGLVVIPFLSAFVSLKVLNLSGNNIVRISAGALPRGLHLLNLSKNKISAIEGLRELTRLRVLDLSYNRIFKIGHGLSSCSSLKELYLAGNKISEVEGLHRLLKLNILDLSYNKFSTAKCLGQLAANHNSLQAISLEGNPAQKNVGDEHLKKQILSVLPHLLYFNRQPIKVSSLKDAADRSVRLGMGAHQLDRGLRSEHKSARKSGHRPSSSSTHGRKAERSRTRHVRLPPPPTGTKAAVTSQHRPHHFDFGGIGKTDSAMRRSRSEGTLGAL